MASAPSGEGAGFRARYVRGIRTSVRDNAAAYGYSVTITATMAVISAELGTPGAAEIFLFVAGAVSAFTVVEAAVSRGFRERLRGEPAEVVALGSALGFASAGGGVGTAALTAEILGSGWAWPLGSLLATTVFLLAVGIELAFAERAALAAAGAEERSEGDEERPS
jgi:small-conductance mechanosensitive channel